MPAAAAELSSSQDGIQADDNEFGRLYSLEWLRQKIASETTPEASLDSADPAEARFAHKVRAMLALAKEEVRRAAADPNPVRLDVRLRCVAKRVVLRSGTHQPFVPALEWSVAADESAPARHDEGVQGLRDRIDPEPTGKGATGADAALFRGNARNRAGEPSSLA